MSRLPSPYSLAPARCRRASARPGRRSAIAASAAAYLAMFADSPAPMSSPASYSVAAFCIISLASSSSTLAFASGCARPWCVPIGLPPQTVRSLAYSTALSRAYRPMPTDPAAAMIRSGLSPANSCASAASSSPMSASAGSRTSSRKSRNCLSGIAMSMSMAVYSKPGVSVGNANSAGLSRPVLASSVRATMSIALRVVDAGDVDLAAVEDPVAAVAAWRSW